MKYTIEARQLTSEFTHRRAVDADTRRMFVEADDAGEALSRFVDDNESEVVSFQPVEGRESIATVKKKDSVYLVRVYSA